MLILMFIKKQKLLSFSNLKMTTITATIIFFTTNSSGNFKFINSGLLGKVLRILL